MAIIAVVAKFVTNGGRAAAELLRGGGRGGAQWFKWLKPAKISSHEVISRIFPNTFQQIHIPFAVISCA